MLIYWFLPMILFLGIVTSYEDIKFGKIRNKWIVISFLYSILITLFIHFFNNHYNLDFEYLIGYFLTALISLLAGFLIWYFGLWTAGDAKLYFAFAIILPFIRNSEGINHFFAFTLLGNIFIPAALFLGINLLFKIDMNILKKSFRQSFKPLSLLYILLYFFGFFWIIQEIEMFFKIKLPYFLVLMIAFSFFYFLFYILNFKYKIVLVIVAISRLVFDNSYLSIEFFKTFVLTIITFLIFRFYLSNLAYSAFTSSIPVSKLKPGMLSAENIYKKGSKLIRIPIRKKFFLFFDSKFKLKPLVNLDESGLTNHNIAALKNYKNIKYLRVFHTVSFAPFIFFGALITIILNGNTLLSLLQIR